MSATKRPGRRSVGATPRLLEPDFPGGLAVLLAPPVSRPLLLRTSERGGDFGLCEGFADFLRVGRLHRHEKSPPGIRGT
jgi:hypothetical protein